MKFLIDENITPDAVTIFRNHGLKAWHINELKSNKKQRIIDDELRRLAIHKGFIIVTRDDDFVRSYVNRKVPDKMVYLYGFSNKSELIDRLEDLVSTLTQLLEEHDFIEVSADELKFPFSD